MRKWIMLSALSLPLLLLFCVPNEASSALRVPAGGIMTEQPGHGGGCRKDSPPGRCCHKDHRTGEVHCH